MHERGQAFRRHHFFKRKRHIVRLLTGRWMWTRDYIHPVDLGRWVHSGRPVQYDTGRWWRRYGKGGESLTIQERKANEDYALQLRELDSPSGEGGDET